MKNVVDLKVVTVDFPITLNTSTSKNSLCLPLMVRDIENKVNSAACFISICNKTLVC